MTRLFPFSLVICILLSLSLYAQPDKKRDLSLLAKGPEGTVNETGTLNSKKPLDYRRKSPLFRYNPVALTLTGTMLVYQHVVSPQLGSGCIYERSCSNFSKAAISEIGVVRGIFLSADRLFRCNMYAFAETPLFYFNEQGKIIDEPSKYRFH